jgi:hypothetical protein
VQMECVPAACTSDADCGDGMVCHEWTETCPTVDCACPSDQPDCECEIPACEPKSESYCTPKYVLPCTVAADCGTGFDCQQLESCGCSGSAGTGGGAEPAPADAAKPLPPDGGAGAPASDPLPPECTCEPSGQFACVPREIPCADDSVCPAGWTCQNADSGTSSGCFGDGCDAAPAPEPLPTTSLCFPQYYGGAGVGIEEDLGTPTRSGDDQGTGSTQNPEAAHADADADANDSAACQMGHAPASGSALSILALLGALFGLSRRRAHARV